MKKVTLNDKTFELSIPYDEIQRAVTGIAEQINKDYAFREPVFIVILNGSFMFAADLLKKIKFNCEVSFVKLSSYAGTHSTHNVRELIGIDESIKGRNVIILEDIIDSGITMEYLLNELKKTGPEDVRIATFLLKPDALIKNISIDYVGIKIPNDFIVGYGLDYNGLGRNLPDIYKIMS
jgi:hypoxanthine phosphoribosyltransferase